MPTRSRAPSAARARPRAASSSAATSTSGDIFSSLFGGGRRRRAAAASRGRPRTHAPARGADVIGQLPITFAEAALGHASGPIRTGGGGTVEISIPARCRERRPAARPWHRARPAPGTGGVPGDLYLDIEVRPDPHLRRAGDDIELDLPVTITEAVLGAKVEVPTVEGPRHRDGPARHVERRPATAARPRHQDVRTARAAIRSAASRSWRRRSSPTTRRRVSCSRRSRRGPPARPPVRRF